MEACRVDDRLHEEQEEARQEKQRRSLGRDHDPSPFPSPRCSLPPRAPPPTVPSHFAARGTPQSASAMSSSFRRHSYPEIMGGVGWGRMWFDRPARARGPCGPQHHPSDQDTPSP